MSKLHEEIFKSSVMTFGEHLGELRTCLWRAILGLAVGVAAGFFLANWIVQVIQSPLENALQRYYLDASEAELRKINPDATAADLAMVLDQKMVFERVYIDPRVLAETLKNPGSAPGPNSAGAAQPAAPEQLFDQPGEQKDGQISAAKKPPDLREILVWRKIKDDPRTRTKSLSGQEPFMIWLKAALIAGLVISSPWVFYQLWMFVAAGLYPKEQKYVHIFLPFSIGLFLFGVAMSTFVFPPLLGFFLSFNRSMGIEPEPRITEWLSFVLFLPLGFGLAFQLPLVMLFLERIGVMSVPAYMKQWRIAVLVIWIIAAIVTPGDPYSIFLLGVPLTALYYGGVLMCKWWPRESG